MTLNVHPDQNFPYLLFPVILPIPMEICIQYHLFLLNNEKDLFVHATGIENGPIAEGDTVEFEIGEGRKGPCAVKVNRK